MASVNRILHPFAPFYLRDVGIASFVLDQNTDQLEFIFQAEESATITRLGLRLGTDTATTPTYQISLQGVTNAGIPDGTIKGATNSAKKTFDSASLGWADGSWNWLTLDETYTVSRGEFLAIVISYNSGTIDGTHNASFTYCVDNNSIMMSGFPYVITNNNGSRSRIGQPISA